MRWVIGILVVVVLVIVGYQYFGREEVDVAEQPGVTEQPEPDVAEQPGVTEQPEPDVAAPAEQPAQETEQAAEETGEAARETPEATEPAAGAAQEELTETQMAALTVGDVNVGEQVTDAVQNVEEALQGVTDAQSAEAAVATLNAVNLKLEELSATVDQLPDDGKKVLADVLNERVAELKTLAADVTAQEGVGEVVNPALEPIIAKLEDWSQQPA